MEHHVRELAAGDPLAIATVEAIRIGDVDGLRRLLAESPLLAQARIVGHANGSPCEMSRTLLHVATDWPGHFPRVKESVAVLLAAGADVNARFAGGPHTETPLHWAASCDDVEVLDLLLDRGADIEASGGVIADGTPIADATAFGQWNAARRLIERGAKTNLWQSATLGLMDRVETCFAAEAPSAEDVTRAFWCACHGGQQPAAEYLLARGADLNWVGYDQLTALDAARRTGADTLVAWLEGRGATSAGSGH
jgi:hypothetical protein